MQEGTRARALTVYLDEADQWHGRPLFLVIVERLRGAGYPGVTVLRGIAGFGAHRRVHTASLVDLGANLPVVIQIVDTPDRIARLTPILEELVTEGLVTAHDVDVLLLRPSPSPGD